MNLSKIRSFFGIMLIPLIYIVTMNLAQSLVYALFNTVRLIINPSLAMTPFSYNFAMLIIMIVIFLAFLASFIYSAKMYKVKIYFKKRIDAKLFFLSIVLGIASNFFTGYLATVLFPNGKPMENAVLKEFTFMTLIIATIAAPVIEELVLRKCMLDAFCERNLSPTLCIIVSSFIFATIHDLTSIRYMVVTFAAGVILAYSYHKSRIILYSIVTHATFNLTSAVSVLIHIEEPEFPAAVMDGWDYIYFAVSAALIFAVLMAFRSQADDNPY